MASEQRKRVFLRLFQCHQAPQLARGDVMCGTELVGFYRGLVASMLRAAGTRKFQHHPVTFKPGEISFASLRSEVRFQEAH